ncbi:hypothetical protein NMG60_11022056 [Bertholletia excelsa]
MPSVGMRRTTRVFGARVLRSGRRLWSGPGEGKHLRAEATAAAANGEEWIELLDNSGNHGGGADEIPCKENGWRHDARMKQDVPTTGIEERKMEAKLVGKANSSVDRMWGSVYQRKRKRIDSKGFDLESNCVKKKSAEDRKYGKQFVRKQRRKDKTREICGRQGSVRCRLAAVVESSCCSSPWFACFLSLVLRYMRRANLRLLQLSGLVLSEPLARVFSSHGIHFLRDSACTRSSGICKFFGVRCFIPLFSVDFSAVPFCFMYMHTSLLLRSACFTFVIVSYSNSDDQEMIEIVEHPPSSSSGRYSALSETISNSVPGKRSVFPSAAGSRRLTGRAVQFRNGVNSRTIRKRRSSLRSRRVKNPSVIRGHKANAATAVGSNFYSSRNAGISLVSMASDRELRSVRKSLTPNIRELKSMLVESTHDISSTCCSANILVIESDRCHRIKGAIVELEISSSKRWSLAVKKDGNTRYRIMAQKVMRSCSSNRITHDIIWTEDNYSWKLEFPDKRDWLIFKELYKQCSDRNAQTPSPNVIPVPGICEISGYAEVKYVPFRRPDSYISVKDDEVSRALAKRTANYDMDSEDEEWLRKFNNEFSVQNELGDPVSDDIFELIIDAFEKAFYCSPDDYADEEASVKLCLDLGRQDVVEAVYSYWLRKRKQKRSALVRVFQCYQPRKDQLLPKPILRKKRSFKRQGRHPGRGKQRTFLRAMAEEQDAAEEQNALLKVQEAKAAASQSEVFAVAKRQRAQLLMENADLAAYRAAMALRIAEAARVAESTDAAASFYLQ